MVIKIMKMQSNYLIAVIVNFLAIHMVVAQGAGYSELRKRVISIDETSDVMEVIDILCDADALPITFYRDLGPYSGSFLQMRLFMLLDHYEWVPTGEQNDSNCSPWSEILSGNLSVAETVGLLKQGNPAVRYRLIENINSEVTVPLCHKPGTPAEKILNVPISAVRGHLMHGDSLGICAKWEGEHKIAENGSLDLGMALIKILKDDTYIYIGATDLPPPKELEGSFHYKKVDFIGPLRNLVAKLFQIDDLNLEERYQDLCEDGVNHFLSAIVQSPTLAEDYITALSQLDVESYGHEALQAINHFDGMSDDRLGEIKKRVAYVRSDILKVGLPDDAFEPAELVR